MAVLFYSVLFIVLVCYAFLKYIYRYWDRVGFVNVKPSIPFGNFGPLIRKQRSFGTNVYDLYWEALLSPYIGIYIFFRPALLVRNPNIVKRILTTDFTHFYNRGMYCNKQKDPMSANLLALRDQDWKNLRVQLTPLFSSGRLRNMFKTFSTEGNHLTDYLQEFANKETVIEMKEIFQKFSFNVIASVFFGLDVNLWENPNHRFTFFLKANNADRFTTRLRQTAMFLCPE